MPARLLRLIALVLLAALAAAFAARADGADERGLQRAIESQRQRERSLSSAAERLGRLERSAARAVAVLERRLAAVQSDLAAAQIRLARTQDRLEAARRRARRLERRVGEVQDTLARLLVARYMGDPPDLVTVVLQADGFNRLLEDLGFVRLVQDRNADLLQEVRVARREARREREVLAELEPRQCRAAAAVTQRRNALATIRGAAARRRGALAQAREARLALLGDVRSDRRRSQQTLKRLRRERRRAALRALARLERQQDAAITKVGPGGPWAIPYAIVECESGGQNLPPNYATASGYYQFIDSTWRGLGGSTPKAHLATKAEQDRLAARLWDGGRGARNWDCAVILGLT
jgi:septal ring factor EnvC (AmiA/AmiB activator)